MNIAGVDLRGSDRRTERRISVHLPVQVRGIDRAGASFEEHTTSENICRNGLAIVLSCELALNVDVEIQILQPRPGQQPFSTRGRVRHVETGESGRVIGIQFTGPRFHRVFVSESAQAD